MTGRADARKPCPLCGGQLLVELATVPFVLGKNVAVIKQVPAEVCDTCGEPFLHGDATDVVTALLDKALASSAEVSVMTYPTGAPVAA
ncbi:MAG TPA: type II toxin-antitoxin system MqsA family antitoxin [Kofleriaceae bacterium]|nr:type II toxin-antitoxin system MqsA family antitoxin [Kofleriaceae bacterium]